MEATVLPPENMSSTTNIPNVTDNQLNQTHNTTMSSNETGDSTNALVQQIFEILLLIVVCVIMVALGCTIELKTLKAHLRRPTGIVIGVVCQFIAFPGIAFGLAHALQLDKWNAIGMILLASSPGGSASNNFTYYCEGEVALSVTMTAISTAVGIGMMPLNAWIYTRSWADHKTVIPIVNIVIGLASMLISVAIGMIIRIKLPKTVKWITRIGSVFGMLMIFGIIAIGSYLYPEVYSFSWQLWLAAALLPALALTVGYIAGSVFCMAHASRRTIALEVGCQNSALTITLITLSYDESVFLYVAAYSGLYTVCAYIIIFISTGSYYTYKCLVKKGKKVQITKES